MRNIVQQGDCLELMKSVESGSVDMILCDLPYGTTKNKWDSIINLPALRLEYARLLKPNGALILTGVQPFTTTIMNEFGLWYKHSWFWNKALAGNFATVKYMPLSIIEEVLVFSNGKLNYNPQMRKGKFRKKGFDGVEDRGFGEMKRVASYNDDYYPTNLLDYPSTDKKNSLHPSQKNLLLWEYLIKTYTNEGDLVLDNCAGSGTTAIACLNTGRDYILMEQEEKYIDVICKRIEGRVKPQEKVKNLFD